MTNRHIPTTTIEPSMIGRRPEERVGVALSVTTTRLKKDQLQLSDG